MQLILYDDLRESLSEYDWRMSITRTGDVVMTFIRDRRYGVLTEDADGDLVLMLTDRSSEEEAEAEVVEGECSSVVDKIRAFLG